MCHNSLDNGGVVNADGDHRDTVIEDVGKQDKGSLACSLERECLSYDIKTILTNTYRCEEIICTRYEQTLNHVVTPSCDVQHYQ